MDRNLITWVIALQLIGLLVGVILIIYLIIRKIKIQKKEDFEKRDN